MARAVPSTSNHDRIPRQSNRTPTREGGSNPRCPATVKRDSCESVKSDTSRRNNLSRERHHVRTTFRVALPRYFAVSLRLRSRLQPVFTILIRLCSRSKPCSYSYCQRYPDEFGYLHPLPAAHR